MVYCLFSEDLAMSKYIWLSHSLGLNDPRPPAIPRPELTPLYVIEDGGAAVQILRVASHTGTHVDAPRHVILNGINITDYCPDEFIFTKPVVVDLRLPDAEVVTPSHLEPLKETLQSGDIALFRFGCAEIRREDPQRFSLKSPGFGVEGARWLRNRCPNLRAIGMDIPSLACIDSLDETMTAHNELLGGSGCRFLVIEDMKLDADLTNLREIRINPWLVSGMDSGPCTVVGVMEDSKP
jgi:kynurenine formamidase